MMFTRVPLDATTKPFYQSVYAWKVKFPFWCIAEPHRPLQVHIKMGPSGPYGRAHAIPTGTGLIAWCFETEHARDKFVKTYGAEVVSIK
jgi:hypothetical protein